MALKYDDSFLYEQDQDQSSTAPVNLYDDSFLYEEEPNRVEQQPIDEPVNIGQNRGYAAPVERPWYEVAADDIRYGYSGFKKNLSQQLGLSSDETNQDKINTGTRLKELERQEQRFAPDTDTQNQLQEISQAKNLEEAVSLMWKYPGAVSSVTLSSLGRYSPALAAMAGTSAASGGATIPVAASTFMGSLSTEYGATMDETIRENGMDPSDPRSWEKAVNDEKLIGDAKERGLKRGVPIAAFDMLSMGLAGRLLAGAKPAASSIVPRALGEVAIQGATGGAGEAAAQLVDKGKIESIGDVAMEAVAEFGPGSVETAIGYRGEMEKARQRDQNTFDQSGQIPETFSPTHNVAGGIEAQPVTKNGNIVPDTYITREGNVIRDANAVARPDVSYDVEYDVNATAARIQDSVIGRSGIIASQMQGPIETNMTFGEQPATPTPEELNQQVIENTPGTFQTPEQLNQLEIDRQFETQLDSQIEMTAAEKNQLAINNMEKNGLVDTASDSELIKTDIDKAAHEAATSPLNDLPEPTQKQKETGKYKKGHPVVNGIKVSVENPKGSIRKGTDPNGKEWAVELKHHYGDMTGTKGADGDPIDVFLGENSENEMLPVFVVNQNDPGTGKFDEHKVLMGFKNEEEAKEAYLSNYEDGWQGLGSIVQATPGEVKDWAKNGDTSKEYAAPEIVNNTKPGKLEVNQQLSDTINSVPRGTKVDEKIPRLGKVVKMHTPSTGQDMEATMTVVDADELVMSNDLAGNINPRYPKEIQPRDRSKGSSMLQIQKMANNLKPELLADNGKSNGGAPVIGGDGVVESGNGRSLAILQAYQQNKAEGYRQHLKENAALYGLSEADIDSIKNPVLVRVRNGDMDLNQRAEFARQANQSGTAPMTPVENAKADADRITDADMQLYAPSAQGNTLATSNNAFLESFSARLGDLQVGGLSTPDGRWTKQMADRVQSAVFYKAYSDEKLLALMAEEADPDIKNILNALNFAAPSFARARSVKADLGDLDIITDLVGAIDLIRKAKADGTTVGQLANQKGLFGDVDLVVSGIAQFIEESSRSSKRLGIGFSEMAKFLETELKNLNQENLFDLSPATKSDIISAANKKISEEYGNEEAIKDLFSEGQNGQEPGQLNDQPGDSGREQREDPGAGPETAKEKVNLPPPDRARREEQDDLFGKTEEQQTQEQIEEARRAKDTKRDGAGQEPSASQAGNDLFANDGRLEPDLFARRAGEYDDFQGREITYEIYVEDEEKSYPVTVDAANIMIEADQRIESLKNLLRCI